MSRYKAYPEYKDSAIEWLDQVPSHWSSVALKYMALEENSLFLDGDWIESKDISGDEIRYITTGNVGEGVYKEQGAGFISSEKFVELNCTEVFCGDVLISRLNAPIGRSCIVPNLDTRIVTSVDNVIFRPDQLYSKEYLVRLFSSPAYFEHTANLARGATMQRISRGLLGNIRAIVPPKGEQERIAAFLDHEIAKIDALIEKQQRLIELLKEKRQAVISHAVTKGLNPKAPMKDSGVEWLVEVPAHWTITQPRHVCSFVGGGTPLKDKPEFWEGDIPWVSPKDMKVDFIYSAQDCISSAAVANSAVKLIDAGAVLIVVRGMILDHSVPVAVAKVNLTINQDMKALVPRPGLSEGYLLYCLKGLRDNILDLVESSAHGTKCLRTEQFDRMALPLPPLPEQLEIVRKLNSELCVIDDLALKADSMIELAQERRTALISAAVTGKIDVRSWQAAA